MLKNVLLSVISMKDVMNVFTKSVSDSVTNMPSSDILYIEITVIVLLSLLAFAYFYPRRKDTIKLYISSVMANEDGSYLIGCGYENNGESDLEAKSGFRVKKGAMIQMKKNELELFERGKHDDICIAIINEDTEMEWYIGEKSIRIDKSIFTM